MWEEKLKGNTDEAAVPVSLVSIMIMVIVNVVNELVRLRQYCLSVTHWLLGVLSQLRYWTRLSGGKPRDVIRNRLRLIMRMATTLISSSRLTGRDLCAGVIWRELPNLFGDDGHPLVRRPHHTRIVSTSSNGDHDDQSKWQLNKWVGVI